tara:strand:+ start:84 stop:419 length:336 start_codon:yes stop_codon:yes gene_type:complete
MKYKYEEIKEHFEDFIKENEEQIKEDDDSYEDLHHECFNTDYYIIGTYKATKWLGEQVFNVIEYIKEYENNNFGEVTTDFSDPEKIVNMYVYIIGEEIVYNYKEKLEKETA